MQNIESELFQLDKKANDGENLIFLESLHSDLIGMFSEKDVIMKLIIKLDKKLI